MALLGAAGLLLLRNALGLCKCPPNALSHSSLAFDLHNVRGFCSGTSINPYLLPSFNGGDKRWVFLCAHSPLITLIKSSLLDSLLSLGVYDGACAKFLPSRTVEPLPTPNDACPTYTPRASLVTFTSVGKEIRLIPSHHEEHTANNKVTCRILARKLLDGNRRVLRDGGDIV